MTEKKTQKKTAKATNHKGPWLWTGLAFFVSLWMFILGVLVGRGTAPVRFDIERLQKELAALKFSALQKEMERYKVKAFDTFGKPDLEFHEALKSAEAKPPPVERSDHGTASPPPQKKPAPAAGQPKKPVERSNEPVSKALEEPDRLFTIQVASSRNRAIADSMVARLKAKGYPAYRESARLPGKGVWYRIRIGSFRDRNEANRFLATLHKDNLKGFVLKP